MKDFKNGDSSPSLPCVKKDAERSRKIKGSGKDSNGKLMGGKKKYRLMTRTF